MNRPSNPSAKSSTPSVRFITVSEEHHGQRLDNFLSRELKGSPKSLIYKIIRKGEVRVNKGRSKPEKRLEAGDQVRVPPVRLAEAGAQVPAGQDLLNHLESSILYEDKGLLVINKPAGLAVHGGSGISLGLIEALRQARPKENLELVHRLDRETSGCLLVAKKRSALRYLQQALREHRVDKTYTALVKGQWPKHVRYVDKKLEKYELDSGEKRVKVSTKSGKEARTDFKVLDSIPAGLASCSIIEAKPITGRTHQIRVHALSVGCPLVADDKYTDDEFNQVMKEKGFKRLFLHASELVFPLPPKTELDEESFITVKADLPDDLLRPLNKLTNKK